MKILLAVSVIFLVMSALIYWACFSGNSLYPIKCLALGGGCSVLGIVFLAVNLMTRK